MAKLEVLCTNAISIKNDESVSNAKDVQIKELTNEIDTLRARIDVSLALITFFINFFRLWQKKMSSL
jgi:hypothetical protein